MQSSQRPGSDTTTPDDPPPPPAVEDRLCIRAARHGRSMEEEEARRILGAALDERAEPPANACEALHRRFAALGGVALDLPPRDQDRPPPDSSGPDHG